MQEYLPWLVQAGVPVAEDLELLMFGDGPELARELAELVAHGKKRATTSLPAAWLHNGESLPRAGQMYIVHDWNGEPLAIIQNTRVDVLPLVAVDERFAFDEGEGDRTLGWWRKAHQEYFSRECPRLGVPFDWNMPVVCQRFRRLFPA